MVEILALVILDRIESKGQTGSRSGLGIPVSMAEHGAVCFHKHAAVRKDYLSDLFLRVRISRTCRDKNLTTHNS